MFSDRSNIPTSGPCRIPYEIFIPSFVLVGLVVLEEKNFERNNIKNRDKTSKRAIIPTWLSRL